jgi:formylglycine-generating enzyme required for sulfatase activity
MLRRFTSLIALPTIFAALLAGASTALLVGSAHATVTMDWVPIGNPGNAPDTASCPNCPVGQVNYTYYISKYDVTNAQYAEFLNTVDPSGSNRLGLFSTGMSTDATNGGITNTGSAGSVYQVKAGFANDPVVYVTSFDALRFANWLNNGRGGGDTETGAYTITAAGIANNTITRNPGANVFLPNVNEWFKAAYYNPISNSYFTYPAGSNTPTVCAAPGPTPNTANCNPNYSVGGPGGVGHVTPVGAYTGSASPYGTFDQGGDVFEWGDEICGGGGRGPCRVVRGGSWGTDASVLAASTGGGLGSPTAEENFIGFRVASLVPEPATALLVMAGVLGLAVARRGR